MPALTIGQLAKKAQVNVETVRYYERRGLMPQPPRRWSGYRQYAQDDVARLQFIKRAQELGFSLGDIRDLLALRIKPGAKHADIRARAQNKIEDIEQKIGTLEAMKRTLQSLTERCDECGPLSDCPILESLDQDGSK